METDDPLAALGTRLRARRADRDRTLASVAERGGLSVPYIANLENGRGNPTLAALHRLAGALDARLVVDLVDADDRTAPADAPVEPPPSLVRFARTARFAATVTRMASATLPAATVRARLLAAMARLGSLSPGGPTDLDWHRVLDAAALIAAG